MKQTPSTAGQSPKERVKVWFLMSRMERIGGAELVIADLIRSIDRARFDVSLVLLYDEGSLGMELRESGITTLSGFAASRRNLLLFPKLARLAKLKKPDVVFTTESAMPMFYAALLRRFGYVGKHVAAFHTTTVFPRNARWAVRFALPRLDRLVVLSAANLKYWIAELKLEPDRFRVILNGIDMNRFKPSESKISLRESLGLRKERLVIGTIGYWRKLKNLALFIDVGKDLIGAGFDAQFVMAGDGPERESLEAQIQALGLADRFVLPGMVDPSVWQPVFDLAVLTSDTEGLPLAVIEAAACGVPVVSTNVGGVPDAVDDGSSGFLVEARDKAALVERCRQLMSDASLREAMGKAGRVKALEQFSLQTMVERYEAVFSEGRE